MPTDVCPWKCRRGHQGCCYGHCVDACADAVKVTVTVTVTVTVIVTVTVTWVTNDGAIPCVDLPFATETVTFPWGVAFQAMW